MGLACHGLLLRKDPVIDNKCINIELVIDCIQMLLLTLIVCSDCYCYCAILPEYRHQGTSYMRSTGKGTLRGII